MNDLIKKENIIFRLMPSEEADSIKDAYPIKDILDIRIGYRYIERKNDGLMVSRPVSCADIDMDGYCEEDFFEKARKNTEAFFKPEIYVMWEMAQAMVSGEEATPLSEDAMLSAEDVYVLTNDAKLYGAGCILYNDLLKNVGARLGCNFYILPSSVHEVLIVPEKIGYESDSLRSMVEEVNRTVVNKKDFLSDTVYYFDIHENCSKIAA